MFTTGISIFGLTLYFVLIREKAILVNTILQLTGANILIHLLLHLRDKFEIRNPIIESIVDSSIIIAILITFGLIFGWFAKVPLWLLVVSGIGYYMITSIITVSKTKKDTEEVNEILDKLNEEK
jgi:hypothetical protein